MFGRRRATPAYGPIPVRERWRQVFESGAATLHPFSPAELDAVTLEPESVRPEGGLPYLLRLSPLLDQAPLPAASPEPRPAGDRHALAHGGAPTGSAGHGPPDLRELASVVAGLEASGYVRPGPPAPAEGQVPVEFAGLAAAADGGPPRRVALAGDLGLITYMRCRPLFVAEVYHAADPGKPDRASAGWQFVARGFTPYEMPGCLIERPPAGPNPRGERPPHVILREDQAAAAMLGWLGGDVGTYLKLRQARASGPAGEAGRAGLPGQAVPTATVAGGFSQLAQLSLALPAGPEVVLRALIVGTAAARHWLLTGEQLELATPATLTQLGDRLDDMLATASRPGAAAPPGWPDAAPPGWPDTAPGGAPGGQDAW